jgi:hypothetical protein
VQRLHGNTVQHKDLGQCSSIVTARCHSAAATTSNQLWNVYHEASASAAVVACRVSFFAVFDGHGGRQCAEYAAEHLHTKVMAAGLVPPGVRAWGAAGQRGCMQCPACKHTSSSRGIRIRSAAFGYRAIIHQVQSITLCIPHACVVSSAPRVLPMHKCAAEQLDGMLCMLVSGGQWGAASGHQGV